MLKQPFYALLLDVRDIDIPMPFTVYVGEEDLESMLVDSEVSGVNFDWQKERKSLWYGLMPSGQF